MVTTANMGMVLPDPSITAGPTWASVLNAALTTNDSHDHTTGKGVAVPTAGININADLDFQSNDAIGLRSVRLDNQVATLNGASDLRILYSKNGELAYRDALGNEVILTSAGSVAGATGTITGLVAPASASFSAVTNTFTWLYDTAKPARLSLADAAFYPYDGSTAYTFAVSLKAPTTLTASHTWTFPDAAATQANIVSISTAGQLTYGAADGSPSAPSIAFASDLDTGFYRVGTGDIGVVSNGALIGKLNDSGFYVPPGSSSTAGLGFSNDPDTGLFRSAANQLGITAGGAACAAFGDSQVYLNGGSVSVPGIAFGNDIQTGLFRVASADLGFACGGSQLLSLNSTRARFDTPVYTQDGAAGTPSFSFHSDSDTGFYRAAANSIGVSAGGTGAAFFEAAQTSFVAGVQTAGGGAIKWSVFTGTIAASGTTTRSITGTILGHVGWTSRGGGTGYAAIENASSSPDRIRIDLSTSDTDTVGLVNVDAGATNSYRLIIYYQ